jgi:cation diffusion facilitator family transporter
MTPTVRLAFGSVTLGLLVLALKGGAWGVTGSAALFSDAAETLVNVAASAMAIAALRLSERPADANHPYGHAKAEFFSAVIEGALIVVAAIVIVRNAWLAWQAPAPIDAPVLGLGLNLAATVLNGVWARILLRAGKRFRSPALRADGRHLAADVVTSLGIAAGLVLALATGRPWLDAVLAAAVAAYILVSGVLVIRDSVGGLMDAAPPPDVVERIRALVATHAQGAIEAHDLRARHAGRLTFLEFHLVVPGSMTVAASHEICDRIEEALKAEMEGLSVSIHVEPDGKAKHQGVVVL